MENHKPVVVDGVRYNPAPGKTCTNCAAYLGSLDESGRYRRWQDARLLLCEKIKAEVDKARGISDGACERPDDVIWLDDVAFAAHRLIGGTP